MLEKIAENAYFLYSKELEYLMAAQEFLMPRQVNKSIEEHVKTPDFTTYQVLKEIFDGFGDEVWGGIIEPMTAVTKQEFTLDAYETYLLGLEELDFLSAFLQLPKEKVEPVLKGKVSLMEFYQEHPNKFKSFLSASILFEKREWFVKEVCSFTRSLQSKETDQFLKEQEAEILKWKKEVEKQVQEKGAFDYSEAMMQKTFYNRGPYETFFFAPAVFMPYRYCRFFAKNQILFFDPFHASEPRDTMPKQLKVLADPTRFQILKLLKQSGHLSGIEIAEKTGLATSTVSHHMSQMKSCGLVHEEPAKNTKYYSVNKTSLETCIRSLEKTFLS